jgi:replicative DNA helicase Mcm
MDKKKSNEELITEAKSFFEAYKREIGESRRKGKRVVFINFEDLAEDSPMLSESLISNPEEMLQILETALEETVIGLKNKNTRIRLNTLPETQRVRIRTIRAQHLNQLIFFEGLVRQASEVRPQVINAKFECPSCGTVISVLQIEKKFREPTRCSCGRKGQFRLMSKTMVDAQRLVIEESPDTLIGGEQPRRISVFLNEDLVEPTMEEKTTPGSRVRVLGILKEVPVPLPTGAISTRFDLAVEANNLIPLESTYEELEISEEDERQIIELSADPELFKRLRESIAPSIYGYDEIKESLVLQMFGGVRKVSPDGTVSRGDIHLFLIGDPGVAKSIGKNEKILYFSKDSNGKETIENLFKKYGKFPKDMKVLTIDMNSFEPKWKDVSEIIKHLPERDLIQVKTEHGKSIVATKDHSFITLSKSGKIISIKGDELNKKIYLPIPINYHKEEFKYFFTENFNKKPSNNSKILPDKIKLDKDFGFFTGIFLAEGYVKNKKIIEISNKNKDIQDKVINFSKRIGLNYSLDKKSVQLYSKNLSDLVKFYCYDLKDLDLAKKSINRNYSRIKKIPDFAFFSPKEFIFGLISGLFSGDGRLIKDKKMLKGFELINISKRLAEETSDLLFSIGIVNKIQVRSYVYNQKNTFYYSLSVPTYMIGNFTKNIEILGRGIKYNQNEPIYSYNNLIPCGDLIYEFVKKLGYNKVKTGNRTFEAEMRTVKKRNIIGRLRLIRLIKEFENKSKEKIEELEILKKIANSNIIWSKVEKIKNINKKNEEVYDLSIPSTNTFVANGIGVHNSVTLKFISNIAPKGRYIVGKATTGAGITATVVKDEFLKGWSLEAGAMVLANKGVVCIDEIEKMDATDRSAMHEALEQQCYHKDTIITLADGGEHKISVLVESLINKNKDKIIPGKDCFILPVHDLEILTTDFKKVFKTRVNRISKHKAYDRFVKIKFSNGREIIVTPEHPVFSAESGKIITKRADSIKIGDPVPIPLTMPIVGKRQIFNTIITNKRALNHIRIPEKNCKEIFKIIGYVISGGSKEKNRGKIIGVNFTNKDKRLLDDFEQCMNKVFNLTPYKQLTIDEYKSRFMYRYISSELARFFINNFPEIIKTEDEKEIPQVSMKGETNNISAMLSTMFEGNGHVSKKKRTIRIGYSTKSKRLAEQLQDLLLRFRIRSNLNSDMEYFKVLITEYENIKNFSDYIGFITFEKNLIIQNYLNDKTIKRTVKDRIPKCFNDEIIRIIKDENIMTIGKYSKQDINFDHQKRKDLFCFSRNFLINLFKLVNNSENKKYLEYLISDVGWEYVSEVQIIENKDSSFVYDITIEPNHTFISKGAILHNTVTISKANVQATLSAQTSVLAAGNPKYGRFEPLQSITEQIDLPPALINRFDLIFVLRDLPNKSQDDAIATHVLNIHQRKDKKSNIDRELFKKYVAYAKQKIEPKLTQEAADEIKNFYVKLRNMQSVGDSHSIAISARQLQGLVRLSEAHAKLRLSPVVEKSDAQVAIRLTTYYLMQVGYDPETKRFDIDRFTTKVSSSQRSKIITLKETIKKLEDRFGKMIPIEELKNETKDSMTDSEFEENIEKLKKSGDLFQPKQGFIQEVSSR